MRIVTSVIAGFSLLLALPVAAQQVAPNTPASPNAGTSQGSSPGMMGRMEMMGERGRGGMGMMMGSRGDDEDDADDDIGPTRRRHHRPEGRGRPMQIIINIGPENRVETEERGGGDFGGGSQWRMGRDWRGRSMAEHVGAHLDYLHDELQLTQEQQPAWDRFASAVRDAATRMHPRPAGMVRDQGLEQRLAVQETMLNSRLEALRSVRAALSGLTSALNDSQKHTLDEVSAGFMHGRSMMQSRWP